LNGEFAGTTSTIGNRAMLATGAKLFTGSYGSLLNTAAFVTIGELLATKMV
jgi:hypothetical protein